MKTKNVILTSMAVFALLVAAFMGITSVVSAQNADLSFVEHGPRGGGGPNLEAVAAELGITAEELKEALQEARPAECVPGERPAEGVDCKPDLDAVATALGISAEELQSAFETVREAQRAERLSASAEELGVTVEELQTALENARPAECADLEPGERPADGVDCRPDLEAVATELDVTVEELKSALGKDRQRGGNLDNVANALDVTTEELKAALQEARPDECVPGERPAEGVDCRPDLEAAAETLGVDVEELETALRNEHGGHGPKDGGRDGQGGRP